MIRQDTYLKIKGSWQTGSTSLFVWTCLSIDRGKEWLPKSLGGCKVTPVPLIPAGRFITPSVYLVAIKSLCFWDLESLFSICWEVLFSSQVWCSLPREKRLFISQDGVKMKMGSFYRLVKDGLWSELAGQLGGRRAQTLRVLSLRSSKPRLEGWLCPSLVLWPRASYLMILSLSLHIFEWEGSRYDQVNVVQV